jgi:hypothetical protein
MVRKIRMDRWWSIQDCSYIYNILDNERLVKSFTDRKEALEFKRKLIQLCKDYPDRIYNYRTGKMVEPRKWLSEDEKT